MPFQTIDPFTGQTVAEFPTWDAARTEVAVALAAATAPAWRDRSIIDRCRLLRQVAKVLRTRKVELAALMTLEMGKLTQEAEAELEKCATTCDYYAFHSASYLADEVIHTEATRSCVAYHPLGPVLAIMPWNFPFWQVVRFAAPTLAAGNVALLKHASNVPQCALALEAVFREAGFPAGVFQTLLIGGEAAETLIADPRIRAVTLTGSDVTGRKVAAAAGANLKKAVLELGGSDAFIVLEDCDMAKCVKTAVESRYMNGGQSCIAAKRFIVVDAVADDFVSHLKVAVEALKPGDPRDATTTLPPLARQDLREGLHDQVKRSLEAGAVAVTGCQPLDRPGYFYAASILDHVTPDHAAYHEEFFGPVAIVIRARDDADALRIANDSRFGLGGSVWTRDLARGEKLARALETGAAFVNALVKSDPRLPFGGVKDSGYGRELARPGILEFVNMKALWVTQAGGRSGVLFE